MKYITLEQKLRATGIARWHIIRTAVPQSLSDHLYSVAMIADSVLAIWSAMYLTNGLSFYERHRSVLIDKALHHDVLEVLTGDMPSPYKRWLRRQGHEVIEPKHLGDFDRMYSRASEPQFDALLNTIVKFADTLEAYHFINRYNIDRHGELAAQRLQEVIEQANTWMPEWEVPRLLIGQPARGMTHAGGPIRRINRAETPDQCYGVDWAGFATKMLEVMDSSPEEISDDAALEGGSVRAVAGAVDPAHGGTHGQDREQAASGKFGPVVQHRREDGDDREQGDDLSDCRSPDSPEAPADSGSAPIPTRTREEVQQFLRSGLARANEPRVPGSDILPVE